MDTLQSLALAGGLSLGSGIRLYATVFIAGLLGRLGWVPLPEGLQVLTSYWVLGISGVLMLGEFLADKIPAFDSVWDAVNTFVRIPAGTLLAWGVFSQAPTGEQVAAALIGGAIVSGTHLAKAGGRALINTSPEPVSNWTASFGEDISLLGVLHLMWAHPAAMLVVLALFLLLLVWLLPKIVRGLRALWRLLSGARNRLDVGVGRD